MKKLLIVVLLIILAVPVLLFFLSTRPLVAVESPPSVVGVETPINLRIESPHGVRRVAGVVEQNGTRYPVFERVEPASRLMFWRKHKTPATVTFPVGRKLTPALKDGKAKLLITAQANDLRAQEASREIEFEIISAPPKLAADGFQHYINQGGCELAVATISGYWTEAGVRVGPYSFRTFPLPGSKAQERFSLFAFPWDLPADSAPVFFARNPGAQTTAHFWYKIFPKKFRKAELKIDDKFL